MSMVHRPDIIAISLRAARIVRDCAKLGLVIADITLKPIVRQRGNLSPIALQSVY
jgi:hypothetical protein